jgi:uncharacterized membrane protein YphA (DoxX/SURF4 family)/thiol-disulfide isomerase/thioredoxin
LLVLLDMLVRLGAGAVLLSAGLLKALDFTAMLAAVHGYRVLPGFLERPLAYGLPWLEITLALFLLTGLFVRFAGVGVAVLSTVFLAVIAQALARGLPIGCGCFGSGGGLSWLDLIRDLPLLVAGIYLARRSAGSGSLDRLLGDAAPREHGEAPEDEPQPRGRHRPRFLGGGWLRIVIPTAVICTVIAAAVGASALTAPMGTAASQGVEVSGAARSEPFPAGQKLPEFIAPALGGGQISWASYRGTPTVLIVWAPWCAECERELPMIVETAMQFPAIKITSIVTAVGQEPGPTPAAYMASHHYSFPVALDNQDQRLADVLGLSGFPVVYYVYPDGTISRATVGVAPQSVISSLMKAVSR